MSETELSHYRLKLEKDTNKIKKSFAALVSNLQYHIRETCKVEDIINHMKFSDRKFDEVLCSCKNVTDVFSDLYKFFSFFDFDIIKMLTSKFGSESCKKKLKKYQKKFREFTKRRVCECPSDTFGNAKRPVDASTQYVLKIEDNIKEYTLKDLEKLQFEMNRILKQKFLRVLHVDKGCIELTFRAVGDVCLKLSEEEKQEMRNLGWLSICCGEKEYQDLRNIERISMAKPGKWSCREYVIVCEVTILMHGMGLGLIIICNSVSASYCILQVKFQGIQDLARLLLSPHNILKLLVR